MDSKMKRRLDQHIEADPEEAQERGFRQYYYDLFDADADIVKDMLPQTRDEKLRDAISWAWARLADWAGDGHIGALNFWFALGDLLSKEEDSIDEIELLELIVDFEKAEGLEAFHKGVISKLKDALADC